MNRSADERLERLHAHHEITTLIHTYARGIDRCDLALLQSVFWDEAVLDYGSGAEPAKAWCAGVIDRLLPMESTMHALSNIMIDLEGRDSARAETYCQAYHALRKDGEPKRMIVGGRYLDRFERRCERWAIIARTYVIDWNENDPSTRMMGTGPFARFTHIGRRFPHDPLYRVAADTTAPADRARI